MKLDDIRIVHETHSRRELIVYNALAAYVTDVNNMFVGAYHYMKTNGNREGQEIYEKIIQRGLNVLEDIGEVIRTNADDRVTAIDFYIEDVERLTKMTEEYKEDIENARRFLNNQ